MTIDGGKIVIVTKDDKVDIAMGRRPSSFRAPRR
jgi:hypothetical protein